MKKDLCYKYSYYNQVPYLFLVWFITSRARGMVKNNTSQRGVLNCRNFFRASVRRGLWCVLLLAYSTAVLSILYHWLKNDSENVLAMIFGIYSTAVESIILYCIIDGLKKHHQNTTTTTRKHAINKKGPSTLPKKEFFLCSLEGRIAPGKTTEK